MFFEKFEKVWDAELANLLCLVSLSEVNSLLCYLSLTDDADIVVSLFLSIHDLFVEGIAAVIDADGIALEEEGIVDFLGKIFSLCAHGDQLNLSWRNPEVPLSTSVLA